MPNILKKVRRCDVISLISVQLRDRRIIDARVDIKVPVHMEANKDKGHNVPNTVRPRNSSLGIGPEQTVRLEAL